MGNKHAEAAPHNAYRCLGDDRWCSIAVFTDDEWRSFCNVIGNPAWTTSPKFKTLQVRKQNEDELDTLIDEWTMKRTAEDVMKVMQAAGVAAGVVQTGQDIMDLDPQLKHRRFFSEVDHTEIGKYNIFRPAYIMSKTPAILKRAPLLSEHNEYCLKEFLGISDEEIAQLVIDGVLE